MSLDRIPYVVAKEGMESLIERSPPKGLISLKNRKAYTDSDRYINITASTSLPHIRGEEKSPLKGPPALAAPAFHLS